MANVDTPFGFKPYQHLNGNPWNGAVRIYYHSASDAAAIYRGDLVQVNVTNDEATGLYPSVKAHVTGQEDNVGVAVGFGNTPQLATVTTNLAANYCPASTAMYIAVVDDPDVLFICQEDSAGTALTAGAVWGFADVEDGTSGSSTTGISGMEIDRSDIADTVGTLQIMRLYPGEGNAIGDYAKWVVRINEHIYRNENVPAA